MVADCPIDVALLEPALKALPDSRALPAAAYASDDVFEWEVAHFFEGWWVCVGRATELAAPGDQLAVCVGSAGILLTCDRGGRLHGFFNVCRHRGHELLAAHTGTNAPVVRCPYHAWTYELDGELRAAPHFNLPRTDPACGGLVPVRIAEWLGWIFVNVTGDAPSIEEHVGNLTGLAVPYGPQHLVTAATHEYEVAANWKIIAENYQECLHCPQLHPELCRVTPSSSGVSYASTGYWIGGSMELAAEAETMSLSGRSGSVPIAGLVPERRRQVLYFGLFPNLLISLHPDYVMTHRIDPISASRSRVECQWLFPQEAVARSGFDPRYAVEFWDLTNRQDWAACESVQRGVASRGYRPGPLAIGEDNVHQFLTMVARGYLDGRPAWPAPAARPTPAAGQRHRV